MKVNEDIKNVQKKRLNPYAITCLILIVIIFASLAGRRSRADTFDAFIDAYAAGDAQAIVDLMPKEYIYALMDKGVIENSVELKNVLQVSLDYLYRYLNDPEEIKEWSFEYEVLRTTEVHHGDFNFDMTIEGDFGDYSGKVKKAVIVYFKPHISAIKLDETRYEKDFSEDYVALVKIGQSWYITTMYQLYYL